MELVPFRVCMGSCLPWYWQQERMIGAVPTLVLVAGADDRCCAGAQALLRALGLGGRETVAAASAGVQWVLKDGVGKMGRLVYMGAYGHTFDCHLKRSRFRTSALFTASLGLDMLTPVFPSHFLLLAAAANIGKSIGLATYLATTVSCSCDTAHMQLVPYLPRCLE